MDDTSTSTAVLEHDDGDDNRETQVAIVTQLPDHPQTQPITTTTTTSSATDSSIITIVTTNNKSTNKSSNRNSSGSSEDRDHNDHDDDDDAADENDMSASALWKRVQSARSKYFQQKSHGIITGHLKKKHQQLSKRRHCTDDNWNNSNDDDGRTNTTNDDKDNDENEDDTGDSDYEQSSESNDSTSHHSGKKSKKKRQTTNKRRKSDTSPSAVSLQETKKSLKLTIRKKVKHTNDTDSQLSDSHSQDVISSGMASGAAICILDTPTPQRKSRRRSSSSGCSSGGSGSKNGDGGDAEMLMANRLMRNINDGSYDDDNDNDDDSARVSAESNDRESNSVFDTCWLCNISLREMSNSDREKHINHCLDSHASEEYIRNHVTRNRIVLGAGSSSSGMGTRGKSSGKEKTPRPRKSKKRSRVETEETAEAEDQEIVEYTCMICHKDLTSDTARNRMRHLKSCAKLNNVSVKDIKQLHTVTKRRKKRRVSNPSSHDQSSEGEKDVESEKRDDLNTSNIFEPFKYGVDERLRGRSSDSTEFTTVSEWLSSLKLSQFTDSLISNGYDTLEVCSILEASDLSDIGITKPGHRKQLLAAAKDLKKTLLFRAKMQQNEEKKRARQQQAPLKSSHPSHSRHVLPQHNMIEFDAINTHVVCEPVSNTQLSREIMEDIAQNNLVSLEEHVTNDVVTLAVPVPQLPASRFAQTTAGTPKQHQSLWSLQAQSVDDISEDCFFTQKTPAKVNQTTSPPPPPSPKSPTEVTPLATLNIPDLYESPNVRDVTPIRSTQTQISITPIVIDDTPQTESSHQQVAVPTGDTPNPERGSSYDSILDEPLIPGMRLFREDTTGGSSSNTSRSSAFTQPRSPVLLASDDEEDDNDCDSASIVPPTMSQAILTQVTAGDHHHHHHNHHQRSSPNKATDADHLKMQTLNRIHESYVQRCNKEVQYFKNSVRKLYDRLQLCIHEYTEECQSDIQSQTTRMGIHYAFSPFIVPHLADSCGLQDETTTTTMSIDLTCHQSQSQSQPDRLVDDPVVETGTQTHTQLNNLPHPPLTAIPPLLESFVTQAPPPMNHNNSPEKPTTARVPLSSLQPGEPPVPQTTPQPQTTNGGALVITSDLETDGGTTSESDFNGNSDSEVRTVDWAKQKRLADRRTERIIRTAFTNNSQVASNTNATAAPTAVAPNPMVSASVPAARGSSSSTTMQSQAQSQTQQSQSQQQLPSLPLRPDIRPVTPMPNFATMKAEELKTYLSRYGVKPGPKAFMVEMCTRIYQSQMPSSN